MIKNWKLKFAMLAGVLGLLSCEPADPLESAIARELKKGIKQDSLFLGLKFGMKQQEFFDHCWDLNKRKIVSHGEGMTVLYQFPDDQDMVIEFNFYPDYFNKVAYKYNATFNYISWAPWNKDLQADVLIKNLQPILLDWYGGNDFIEVKSGTGTEYHKIDGNRQITLSVRSERFVAAIFTDLSKYGPNTN